MSLKLKINVDDLAKQCKEFAEEARQDLMKGVETLAASAALKVRTLAQQELHSTRNQFLDALPPMEQIAPGVFWISILEEALFVEEGITPGKDMKPDLLKNAKEGKNGRYKVIPFEHSKAPQDMPNAAIDIVAQLKNKLKQENRARVKRGLKKINMTTIEKDIHGSPKIGKLHEFDWGGNKPGRGNTPVLDRVTIYQTKQKNGSVKRGIFTFRTVTENTAASKWHHPGLKAKKFLDRVEVMAIAEWETEILPEILKKWQSE